MSSGESSAELKRLLGVDGSVEMTEDDLKQCMGVFKRFSDEDRIPLSKLKEAFDDLQLYVNEVYVEEIVDAHLKRGVQHMEFYDFASLVCTKRAKKRRSTHAVLVSIFSFLDKDQDGFIGAHELKETMNVLGEIGTDEKVNRMIGQMDRGGTGKVSYEDFVVMLRKSIEEPR